MLMVQSNAPVPMKTSKIKGPPPVPPRPNQSVVAEALAKTRKAVAESRANLTKSRTTIKQDTPAKTTKAKTLERTKSTEKTNPKSPPKQNGLARVKSFIRDVISDRSSSSDEKRSSGTNSRRSSSDSSSIPSTINSKKSNESLNSKAVKTCKQILVRSLSTSSSKTEPDKPISKVSKSSSFAEKTLPLRKAPPPPLSPKPKLRPLKPLPLSKPQSLERVDRTTTKRPELSLYSSPIDAKKPKSPASEPPYATVVEAKNCDVRILDNFDDKSTSVAPVQTPLSENSDTSPISSPNTVNSARISTSNSADVSPLTSPNSADVNPLTSPNSDVKTNSLERKTSRVTEMLISEILASRNKDDANSVIDKGKDDAVASAGDASPEIRKDMNNHEMLIYELQTMRSQSNVPETVSEPQNVESVEKVDEIQSVCSEESEDCPPSPLSNGNIESSEYADPYACIDDNLKSRLRKQFRAISTMSLHGLPPLPKSLSGFADSPESDLEPPNPAPGAPEKALLPGDLDGQLDYLKKEMASLRQLDLSLLSELWTLSESMSSWRRQLERGMRLRPAPPPPLPPHYLRT